MKATMLAFWWNSYFVDPDHFIMRKLHMRTKHWSHRPPTCPCDNMNDRTEPIWAACSCHNLCLFTERWFNTASGSLHNSRTVVHCMMQCNRLVTTPPHPAKFCMSFIRTTSDVFTDGSGQSTSLERHIKFIIKQTILHIDRKQPDIQGENIHGCILLDKN